MADSPLTARALPPGAQIASWIVERPAWPGLDGWFYVHDVTDGHPACLRAWMRSAQNEATWDRVVDLLRMVDVPTLPVLLDSGDSLDCDVLFITIERFEGDLLSDLLLEGKQDWRDVCTAMYDTASALAVLHAHGWVHRDVHPDHVLVARDGRAMLVGFDKAMNSEALSLTAETPLGNLSYCAPEGIASADRHSPRSDLYALGVVFYEALTGGSAFPAAAWGGGVDPGARMLEWKTRARSLDPGPSAPPWLGALIRKSTHPEPEKRLTDMEAVVGWLEAAHGSWTAGHPVVQSHTVPVSPPPRLDLGPALRPSALADLPRVPPTRPPYVLATSLGVISGMAFSMVAILIVELALA